MGELPDDKFANSSERPAHLVHVPSFALGVCPVTNSQYLAYDSAYTPYGAPNEPVVRISWHQAKKYCQWLRWTTGTPFRLPSEAEWEYAATAGNRQAYPRGAELGPEDANYYYTEHGQRVGPGHLTPVGSYPANSFGIHDLHGNVTEWTADLWHRTYDGAPIDGTAWTTGGAVNRRVARGGAWDQLPRLLRSTNRDPLTAETQADNLGFRVAHSLLEPI